MQSWLRPEGARATAVFLCTATVVALFVAFVPHRARSTPSPYAAVNGSLTVNYFYDRVYVAPLSKPDTYGIATLPLRSAAGGALTTEVYVRPTGAPGGSACLVLLAVVARGSEAPPQTTRVCRPLAAGWNHLVPPALRTDAPELVYAQLLVYGNPGGVEARRLAVAGA